MLVELLAVMAPVLIVAGIGYGWARSGQPYQPTSLPVWSEREYAVPGAVHIEPGGVDLGVFSQVALACVIITGLMAMVGLVLSRLLATDARVLVPAYMFPNTGNMGLPISLYAFGEAGLAWQWRFRGAFRRSFQRGSHALRCRPVLAPTAAQPVIISLCVAVGVLLLDLSLPRWLDNTVSLLGSLSIPMMLLTLGVPWAVSGRGSWGGVRAGWSAHALWGGDWLGGRRHAGSAAAGSSGAGDAGGDAGGGLQLPVCGARRALPGNRGQSGHLFHTVVFCVDPAAAGLVVATQWAGVRHSVLLLIQLNSCGWPQAILLLFLTAGCS